MRRPRPAVLDQDAVSEGKLEAIGRAVRGRGVDAVLYLDRLDHYKVDTLDRKVGWLGGRTEQRGGSRAAAGRAVAQAASGRGLAA